MRITVALNERALVLVDQLPVRYLGPGRHRISTAPWRELEVRRYDTERLLAELPPGSGRDPMTAGPEVPDRELVDEHAGSLGDGHIDSHDD